MNDLFISMDYNDREFEGIDDFKSELEKEYSAQVRPKWIPAFSEGAECWFTIFVNSEITNFLASAIAGGFAWDIIKVGAKSYVFEPFFNALEKLNKRNETKWNGLRILKLKFQFDDCEIFVGGLNKNFTSVMSSVFQEIAKKKPEFERRIDQQIIRIELPIEKFERKGLSEREKYTIDTFNEDYSIGTFLKLWKLTCKTDFPVIIYNFEDDTLKEI